MKNKKIKSIKKVIIAFIIIILNALGLMNTVYASSMEVANIYSAHDCGRLLTYKGTPIKVSYVEYIENEMHYPAYCMDKTKPGVETYAYSVSIQGLIKDVGLWKRIINGYPYKTIEELGVANKEEAFTATKQAVYCYIHGNNPEDYGAIGEAGQRTLNAMKKIIENANNSNETKISSTLSIVKNESEWKQDNKEKEYAYKTYKVQAGSNIENYKITITKPNGKDLGGLKLVDENNQERKEFEPDENFKILIPIKNMTEKESFEIKVEAKIKTMPVLYGMAQDSSCQDYAVTTGIYEDGTGKTNDEYEKNETKITIVKKDQENGELLEGVEFELLDEKQKVVYTELKTNEQGKIEIENLIPGTYYLKETKTKEGYELYDSPIRIEISFNQEMTVTINNQKQEKPKIEKTTVKSKETLSKSVKKLPITGM